MAVIRRKKRQSGLGSFIDDGSLYGGYNRGNSKGISIRRVILSVCVTIILVIGAILLYEMDSGFRAVRDRHRISNKNHRSVIRTGQQQHNINNKKQQQQHMLQSSSDNSKINQQQQQMQSQKDETEVDETEQQQQQEKEKEHDLTDSQEQEELSGDGKHSEQNGNINNKTQQQQQQQQQQDQQIHDDKVYNKSFNLTDIELQNQMSKPPIIPTEQGTKATKEKTTKTTVKTVPVPVPEKQKKENVVPIAVVDHENDKKIENQGPKQIQLSNNSQNTTTINDNDNNKHRYYAIEINNLVLSTTNNKSSGIIIIETYPEWAPIGVQHLHMLFEKQFYNNCKFFRVIPNFMVQFGINGNPDIQKQLSTLKHHIVDDIHRPIQQSNVRGTISYAMSGNNTRTTQLFINTNTNDNKYLDQEGFVPVAKVLYDGMETIIDHIYSNAREQPQQSKIQQLGNLYLNKEFPQLSYIKSIQQLSSLSNYKEILSSSSSLSSNNSNANIHNNNNNSSIITNTA